MLCLLAPIYQNKIIVGARKLRMRQFFGWYVILAALKGSHNTILEALVSLGLAGNVIQLVQFSSQLTGVMLEICRKGNPPSLEELQILTINIIDQTDNIRS